MLWMVQSTANALFAVGLTRHFGSQGLTANAVNPGGTHTGLQEQLSREDLLALGWIDQQGHDTSHFKTTEEGAATSIWAAVGQELEGIGGRYLENCQEAAPSDPHGEDARVPFHGFLPYALDPERAERLWTASQGLVGSPAIYVKALAYVRGDGSEIGSNRGHLFTVFHSWLQIHGNRYCWRICQVR